MVRGKSVRQAWPSTTARDSHADYGKAALGGVRFLRRIPHGGEFTE
jgi:hypothetical protein